MKEKIRQKSFQFKYAKNCCFFSTLFQTIVEDGEMKKYRRIKKGELVTSSDINNPTHTYAIK